MNMGITANSENLNVCHLKKQKKGLANEKFLSEPSKLHTQSWFIAPSART